MRPLKTLPILGISLLLTSSAYATLVTQKVTLKGNMIVTYNQKPQIAKNFNELFTQGKFFGRLRLNSFYWDWDKNSAKLMDNKALGLGASLIYKTAKYKGLSGTLALYTSQNPSFFREEQEDVALVKAGKDTFSRYNTDATGRFGITTFAQAYLQYENNKISYILGRQLFESVFTKSNDTKMIPNSFDGLTTTIKYFDKTTIKLAYLAKQKLRDHSSNHDVIAVNGWKENDDASVNKNLTVERVGDNNALLIGSITNNSIKNLKTNLSVASVPDIVTTFSTEAYYTIPLTNGFKIISGFRYMQQIDNLDASYDVANLKANSTGYKNPKSLESSLIALKIDLKNKAFLARLGYSSIADKADIIAPWRGFPTGGFTRAMGQYNWYANTKTYMLRLGYDFSKANIINGFSIMGRYAIQDFDDNKPGVQADSNILHIDLRQNINNAMELKIRLGFVDVDTANTKKTDTSYNEYRIEMNYFF